MSLDAGPDRPAQAISGSRPDSGGPLTVHAVLTRSRLSARLASILRNDSEFFRSWSVAAYFDDVDGFRRAMMRLDRVGPKRFTEVSAIMAGVDPSAASEVMASPPEPQAMPDWLMGLDVLKVGLIGGLSTRLEGVLKNDYPHRTVGDYVRDPEGFKSTLMRLPNFGRKSLNELVDCLETVLANGARPDPERPFDVRRSDVSHGFEVARRMIFGISPDPRRDLEAAVMGLRDRLREVVLRRFGALGRPRMTLDEIGSMDGITRERVRQMEISAFRVLSTDALKAICEKIAESEGRAAWRDLSLGMAMVPFAGISVMARQRLDPIFQIAVTVAYGGVREWLDGFFQTEGANWIEPSEDPERSDAVLRALASLGDVALPQRLPRVASMLGFDPRDIEIALRVPWDFVAFEGYLSRKPNASTKRAVRLHALAMALPDPVFDCKTLLLRYQGAHQDPVQLSNSCPEAMDQNAHLFLNLYDSVYVAIGHGLPPAAESSIPMEDSGVALERSNDGTLRDWMSRLLSERGPMPLSAVSEDAARHFGSGYPARNVWPTAHMFRSFKWELPGVVGVYGGPSPDWDDPSFAEQAFKSKAVAAYLVSKRSGECGRLFPLWDGAYERRLCERLNAESTASALYASALSVADVDSWDIDASARAAWKAEVARSGRWRLDDVDDGGAFSSAIGPIELLKAAFHLSRFGALSLTSANRILGSRLGGERGLALMALMAASGMGVATSDASGGLSQGPALAERRMELEGELSDRGWLSWSSGFGRDVLQDAADGSAGADLGWVGADRVRSLVSRLLR